MKMSELKIRNARLVKIATLDAEITQLAVKTGRANVVLNEARRCWSILDSELRKKTDRRALLIAQVSSR